MLERIRSLGHLHVSHRDRGGLASPPHMIGGMSAHAHPAATLVPARESVDPTLHLGSLVDLSRLVDTWEAALPRARRRHRARSSSSRARWRRDRIGCWRRCASRTRSGSSPTRSGTTPRCTTTRISATTPSTRRRQRVQLLHRALAAGDVVVQPRAAAHPARDRPRLDGRVERPRALPLLHRGSVPPAGTRARRGRRAAAVAVEPARQRAARRLCGAVDGGRALPDDYALDRRVACR